MQISTLALPVHIEKNTSQRLIANYDNFFSFLFQLEYGTIVVQNHSETVGRYYNISNITISNLQEVRN